MRHSSGQVEIVVQHQ